MSSAAEFRPGNSSNEPAPGTRKGAALGLTSASGLVAGSVIGTGVFTMPAVLAGAGTSSLVVLGVIAVGAVLLGVLFGQLTRRVPNVDGGLYAYARYEFGDFAGYLTGWCYWISAWAGNAAIVASWVMYVDSLLRITNPAWWVNWMIALTGLWVPALVNLVGIKQMAWFQNLTVVLKFLPLLVVGVAGWFFVSQANFPAFNASGGSLYQAVGIAAGVALFSFIGVEVAAITAKRVQNPAKNVGWASVLGTAASAMLYLVVSAAVMGLVPHDILVASGTPFVPAFQTILSHAGWAGTLVAALAVVSGIGALNGWTLVTAEVSRAAAADGLFPRAFAWTDRKNTAWFGVLLAALLPSLLMLWRYTSGSGLTAFTYLVNLTVVTVAIPYLFSACAQLSFLLTRRRRPQGWLLARDLLIAVAAVLFSLWVTFAAGYAAVYQAMVMILAGVILYAVLNAHRANSGQIGQPDDVPPAEGNDTQLPDAA